MSGPITSPLARGKPCVACGSRRTIRWVYGGQVYCEDGVACGRRMTAQLNARIEAEVKA